MKPIVPETRKKDVPMSDKELSASRSVLGNLGWAAKQTQPHGTYDVSRLLGELSHRGHSTKRDRTVLGRQHDALRIPLSLRVSMRFAQGH